MTLSPTLAEGPTGTGSCSKFPGLQISNCVLQIINFEIHNFPSHGRVAQFLQAKGLASLISTVPTDAPVSHVGHLGTIEGSDGLAGAC